MININIMLASLQACKLARLQGCKVARLQGCKLASLQACNLASLHKLANEAPAKEVERKAEGSKKPVQP